jgi:NAD(P)-dependent dehydrogenase (short-subunit alcohol dehydrogenase family)
VGAREYPAPPFPKQHQSKPGSEAELKPVPLYDAPFYRGSGKLENKVALITGGDSGIGRAVAILFAREGAGVAIAYLRENKDAKLTKQNIEAEGRRRILIAGDVSDQKFCKQAVARTVKELGGLDVLVNNAAFQVHTSRFEDLTSRHFDETLKTNLYGYFHMAQAAAPQRKPDLVPRGIRVNVVAPGPVWTPLNPSDREAEDVSHFGAKTPMKRPAQPEKIAPAYVFLASPQCSSYITGEILPIIGGYSGG